MLRLEHLEQGALVGWMSDVQGSPNRGPHLPGAQAPTKSAWHEGHVQRADRPQTEGAVWGACAPSCRLGGQASPHSLLWLVGKWVFSIKWYARREPTNGELGSRGGLSKQIDVWKNRARGYSALTRVWPLLTLLPFSHWKWGVREDWRGQSTNTGPAPNPHHALSNQWHPKTEWGWGYAAEWGPSPLYWPNSIFMWLPSNDCQPGK